ncbi:phosphoribosylanthranilate isomerase [Acinetobacter rathckeae]|uniref:phosphoribosylanthranilate isomerase n=1 Tax=Acinetobacter rathckeae TaxID=2605272 RepID=UPI0018A3242B|nr:phosphoribosylanthranilate isomerase [Acinetobacter rathckeae]MBF7687764.1 phosphoribosylanthranilate isomerase [Acinetobacter rathckeae]MBF7688013.1 phosphoribosylanthranilate isomerase [Acinetobacter rathckeae]MBF7695933.1 phosphoribosylanthranilate isomerase [Acinetobacter rathckeae]
MRTRSKICGITRVEDARAAVDNGADAIGLVFYPPSPRAVTPSQAQQIAQVIPPYVQIVGLFVDASLDQIESTLQHVTLDVLQFHGQETPAECASIAKKIGRRWYKAIQVHPTLDIQAEIQRYCQAGASAVLLDAWHPSLKGGTGQQFDWSVFPKAQTALILAGGLTPDNVKQAITTTTPFAVDVSGGVESAKGIKDHQLIKTFMQGVHCGSANED